MKIHSTSNPSTL